MATHFERQLEALHVQIITMGGFCEKAISLSIKQFGVRIVSKQFLRQTEKLIQKNVRLRISVCVSCFTSSR